MKGKKRRMGVSFILRAVEGWMDGGMDGKYN
jgi:hypothetical protein